MVKSKILVILGPTATGKSDLAVKLAKKYSGEVISADSRQVYKGLDIGTGKTTKREMQGVKHHMLDVISPKKLAPRREKTIEKKTPARLMRAIEIAMVIGKVPVLKKKKGEYKFLQIGL